MQLEKGDYLESNFRNLIRSKFINYEIIWGNYFGNNGNQQLVDFHWLSEPEQKVRILSSQYSYTILESLICMNNIAETKINIDLHKPTSYLSAISDFMAFQSHAGRIKDNFENLLNLFFKRSKSRNLLDHLNNFYQERNTVLHGIKIPIRIEESLLLIAPPSGESPNPRKWDSKMNWEDFNLSDFEFIEDYLKKTVDEIFTVSNDLYGNLLVSVKQIFSHHKEDFKPIDRDSDSPNFSTSITPSGILFESPPRQWPISGSNFSKEFGE